MFQKSLALTLTFAYAPSFVEMQKLRILKQYFLCQFFFLSEGLLLLLNLII
jgi:hypothetical protein